MNQFERIVSAQRGVRFAVDYHRGSEGVADVPGEVSSEVRTVLLAAGVLADLALRDPGGYCGVSAVEITEVTGLSVGQVEEAFDTLVAEGVLLSGVDGPGRFRFPNHVLDDSPR